MKQTNTKQARDHVRAYIIENYNDSCEGYNLPNCYDFKKVAQIIVKVYKKEFRETDFHYLEFSDYLRVLPSLIDTTYLIGSEKPTKLLCEWLEATTVEVERKFTLDQMWDKLNFMIFSEINRVL